MKTWKGLSIYPKILEKKPLSGFSKEEKEHLSRKGFRWYVYFRFLNPETNKFDKIIAPTLKINRNFPNFDDRYREIKELKISVKQLLEDGKSPFEVSFVDGELLTIEKALDLSLLNKKSKVGEETYKSYELRVKQLKDYLRKKGLLKRDAHTFNFRVLREFLNKVARDSSMANRNNVLRALKSIFTDMYKNEYIQENYLRRIDIEKTANNRFKSYSYQQAISNIEYLENNNPILALFVKFVGYNFLRVVEVARLKVGDLNLEEKTLTVRVKQGSDKTKRIPDEIITDLSKYDLSKKDNFLFGLNEISGKWKRNEKGRGDHYSRKYTAIMRELGFGEGYTLYSNRHTFATIGYRNLRKRLSKDDTMDTLMGYTGHSTREALKKYIHYIDAEIVDEYKGIVE